jgi:hypothetical protein
MLVSCAINCLMGEMVPLGVRWPGPGVVRLLIRGNGDGRALFTPQAVARPP